MGREMQGMHTRGLSEKKGKNDEEKDEMLKAEA